MLVVGLLLGLAQTGATAYAISVSPQTPKLALLQRGLESDKATLIDERASALEGPATIGGDDLKVSWDNKRGLTLGNAGKTRSTFLVDVPTSPRLFTRDEIVQNATWIKSKLLSKQASVLVEGTFDLGKAYMTVRWAAKPPAQGFDMLVSWDSATGLVPTVVGKWPALAAPGAEFGLVAPGTLGSLATRGKEWGFVAYNVEDEAFSFEPRGTGFSGCNTPWPNEALVVESPGGGTSAVYRATYGSPDRQLIAESRGSFDFIRSQPLTLRLRTKDAMVLRNIETGLETRFSPISAAAGHPWGVVVWSPSNKPTRIAWVDPKTMKTLARWEAPPPAPATKPQVPAKTKAPAKR